MQLLVIDRSSQTSVCLSDSRYDNNIKSGGGTADEKMTLRSLAEMREIPESDRVCPDCPHAMAVVIFLVCVENTDIRSVTST
jgi:hypothetical protein